MTCPLFTTFSNVAANFVFLAYVMLSVSQGAVSVDGIRATLGDLPRGSAQKGCQRALYNTYLWPAVI